MVLEHLFPEDWLERKTKFAFLLGAGYSVIGISIAKLLFPSDPALVAVAFTSLLMLPEMYKIFSIEERQEAESYDQDRKLTFGEILKDDTDFIKVYIFLFLGILTVYSLASLMLPSFQINYLFKQQLAMRHVSGGAFFPTGLFWSILTNNFFVLVACFLISMVTGDGAIFLITWNASVWGTIFGVTARNAAENAGTYALFYLLLIFIIVFPHMIIEALAYILGAISGGIISKDVILEKFESERFRKVFEENFMLFVAAISILILGAIVETWVLGNVETYRQIIQLSYGLG
ncbi:stage II sporulation protein M [Candidatus Woesearchaeota archaeon]|nr:stage II sporulation protein M [Candidatus Woesearchaeota archaeon]